MRARREAYLLQNAAYLVYASVFSGSTAFWGCVRHVKIIKMPLINQRHSVKKLTELPSQRPREQSQSARFMPREGHYGHGCNVEELQKSSPSAAQKGHLPTTSNLRLKAPPRHISQSSFMSLQQESPNLKDYETPGRKYPRVSYQGQTTFRLTSSNQR